MAFAAPIRRVSLCVPPPPGKAPILISGRPKRARLRGDAKIGRQRQLAAAAERITGNRGDHRLRQRLDLIEQNLKLPRVVVGGFGAGGAVHLADVRAGAKDLVAAGDDHGSYLGFAGDRLEGLFQLLAHLAVE